jgi:hypothetical protein
LKLCIKPQEKIELEIKIECCKKYNHPFFLFFKGIKHELFTKTSEDREVLLSAFNYAILFTKEI